MNEDIEDLNIKVDIEILKKLFKEKEQLENSISYIKCEDCNSLRLYRSHSLDTFLSLDKEVKENILCILERRLEKVNLIIKNKMK